MAVIKNENGEVFYTNSEYYEKQKSDNMVIGALIGSIVIGIIFYTMFYPFFGVTKDIIYYSNSIKEYPHYASVVTLVFGGILYYKAKKKNVFFTDKVYYLPFAFAVFLAVTIYVQSTINEKHGREYSFASYFNTHLVKKDENSETNIDKIDKFIVNFLKSE